MATKSGSSRKAATSRPRRERVTARSGRDAQLSEFAKRDLGADIERSGSARVLRRRTQPTSILLDKDLIDGLRAAGAKRGLGYQTMLKMILREKLGEYA